MVIKMLNRTLIILIKKNINKLLSNKRLILTTLILLCIFIFKLLNMKSNKYSFNIFDFILYVITDFSTVVYALNFVFLFFIGDMFLNLSNDEILIIRCSSRKQWYLSKFISIILVSILYTAYILVLCLVIGMLIFRFNNLWSDGIKALAYNKKDLLYGNFNTCKIMFIKYSPITVSLISVVLLFFSFSILGMIFFIGTLIFNVNVCGFAFSLSFIILDLLIVKLNLASFYNIALSTNELFFYHDIGQNTSLPNIQFSFLYWSVTIFALYILGKYLFLKKDIIRR